MAGIKNHHWNQLDEVKNTTLTACDENYVKQNLNHAHGENQTNSDPLKYSLNAMNNYEPLVQTCQFKQKFFRSQNSVTQHQKLVFGTQGMVTIFSRVQVARLVLYQLTALTKCIRKEDQLRDLLIIWFWKGQKNSPIERCWVS